MTRRATYLLFVTLSLSGCYDSARTPETEYPAMTADISLHDLHGMYRGATFEIKEDITAKGYITSSDEAGNFYRTFTISDGTGAAEIMAGTTDLHNEYPIGHVVFVKLKGCAIGENRRVMQIGTMPDSFEYYETDYFYSDVLIDRHIIRSGEYVDVEVPVLEFNELTADKCGCLVKICDLKPVAREDSEAGPDTWSGYRCFTDNNGNQVYTYTSEYADYADNRLPSANVDITGILQYGSIAGQSGEHYILKMRSDEDCSIQDGNN